MQSPTDSGNSNQPPRVPSPLAGIHLRRPSTSSFTTARDQPSPGLFDTHSEMSRHEFQNNLTMYGQLTKMTSSLSVCMPEMEKLSTTLLDWCRSVDKSFSMLQSEIVTLRDEISSKNAQIHGEFHRSVTEMQQLSEATYQEKCTSRLETVDNRLEAFSQKITQLQDQLFQKMTSVLEVQTNFSSVVNTLRRDQETMHDEIRKVTDDCKKLLEENSKNINKNNDGLVADVQHVQQRVEHIQADIRMQSTALDGLSTGQKDCMDNCYGLGQKIANVQMELHDQIAGFHESFITLDRKIGRISNQDGQNNNIKNQQDIQYLSDEMKHIRENITEHQEKISELSHNFSDTVADIRHKDEEQDERITSLENTFRARIESQITESTDNIHLNKDVGDLLKKVNVIFETVGTLRTEVAGLKSAQSGIQSSPEIVYVRSTNSSHDVYAKPVPEYSLPFLQKQPNHSTTCSLGYENCFLSKSGLCTDKFHLPKKEHAGFRSVTPSFIHEGTESTSHFNQLNEAFRDIVAKNVVSVDEASLMNINNARNISGHI